MPIGISDKSDYGDLGKVTPGQVLDYVVQQHRAERAKLHHDLRIGNRDLDLYSWASRKGIPAPGRKVLAVRQPLHSYAYKDFQGKIPVGEYGAGAVKKQDQGQVLITQVDANGTVHFTQAHIRQPQRFALVPLANDPKHYLLVNTTKTAPLPYQKISYKKIPQQQAHQVIANLQPGSSVQAKIDGAHTVTSLLNNNLEILSPRTTLNKQPILYTEKVLGSRPKVKVPREFNNLLLKSELYGVKDDKVIPAQELGGLLNATIANSLQQQRQRNITLKNLLFDVARAGKKPINLTTPYQQRFALLKKLLPYLPQDKYTLPQQATTPSQATKLLQDISQGKNVQTREGLIIHPSTGKPSKIKLNQEHDVIIAGFTPGQGQHQDKGVGAILYAYPDNPTKVIGSVGTGLSHALRRDMLTNPATYLGRTARIAAQEKYPQTQALRAPVFIAVHEDKTPVDLDKQGTMLALPVKVATLLKTAVKSPVLQQLLLAKQESDRGNYLEKVKIMQQLLVDYPDEFIVDSTNNNIVGISHPQTGFRLHLSRRDLPESFRG